MARAHRPDTRRGGTLPGSRSRASTATASCASPTSSGPAPRRRRPVRSTSSRCSCDDGAADRGLRERICSPPTRTATTSRCTASACSSTESLAEYWHQTGPRGTAYCPVVYNVAEQDPDRRPDSSTSSTAAPGYSFGTVPARDLEDRAKMVALLEPERIGVEVVRGTAAASRAVHRCVRAAPPRSEVLQHLITGCAQSGRNRCVGSHVFNTRWHDDFNSYRLRCHHRRRTRCAFPTGVRDDRRGCHRARGRPPTRTRRGGSVRDARFGALRVPVEFGGFGASVRQLFGLLIDLAAAESNLPQALRVHWSFVEDQLLAAPTGNREPGCALWRRGHWSATPSPNPVWVPPTATRPRLTRRDGHWVLDGMKYYSTGSVSTPITSWSRPTGTASGSRSWWTPTLEGVTQTTTGTVSDNG